jgi:hypothetical protein
MQCLKASLTTDKLYGQKCSCLYSVTRHGSLDLKQEIQIQSDKTTESVQEVRDKFNMFFVL